MKKSNTFFSVKVLIIILIILIVLFCCIFFNLGKMKKIKWTYVFNTGELNYKINNQNLGFLPSTLELNPFQNSSSKKMITIFNTNLYIRGYINTTIDIQPINQKKKSQIVREKINFEKMLISTTNNSTKTWLLNTTIYNDHINKIHFCCEGAITIDYLKNNSKINVIFAFLKNGVTDSSKINNIAIWNNSAGTNVINYGVVQIGYKLSRIN